MKLTVSKYLNIRVGAPSASAKCPGYLNPADTLEIQSVCVGDEIEGNNIWYQGVDGSYYWSGGFDKADWAFEKSNTWAELSRDQQIAWTRQCIESIEEKIKKETGNLFLGISVGYKHSNGVQLSFISIIIMLKEKHNNPVHPIPSSFQFKGYSIPTDVQVRNVIKSHGAPGVGIRRVGTTDKGLATIVVKDNNYKYIVSCYHVLAPQELAARYFAFDTPDNLIGDPHFRLTSSNEDDGIMWCGYFSCDYDFAMARLYSPEKWANTAFTEMCQTFDDQLIGKGVSCISQEDSVLNGKISNMHASVCIFYPALGESHTLYDLIEIENLNTKPGDSGSPLYISTENKNILIAMIISGDGKYSYALPIYPIIKNSYTL